MDNFNLSQSDAQIQAILNKIQPLAQTGDMATLGFGYGVCDTAGATAAKTVSITNFVLTPGSEIHVLFQNAFTASSPTLSVNGSAAKPIKLFGNAFPMGKAKNNTILNMNYDGTNFNVTSIESQVAPAPADAVDLALPSGVLYKVIKEGKGAIPTADSKVICHYEGRNLEDSIFDSSYKRNQPFETYCNRVIKGWTDALTNMPVGSIWEVFIPQELAYAEQERSEFIKPFSMLKFKIELLEIVDEKK